MRLLDRYIIRNFLINYLLAFGVMVGMYVLLDLIINFDQFTRGSQGGTETGFRLALALLGDIGEYYAYQLLVIFQQVSAAIPLMAAGFTMVRMTRHNELTAILASGVSLYRVALPIILCAVVFTGLVLVDQEFLMPNLTDKLLRRHDEVNRSLVREDPLYFTRDSDNSLIMASSYNPVTRELKNIRILRRDAQGKLTGRTMAPLAVWDPNLGEGRERGGWFLKEAVYIDDRSTLDPNQRPERYGQMQYLTGLTPRQLELVFSKKAIDFLSTSQINELIVNSPPATRSGLEKLMHVRFTQPLMNLVMLLLGIPFLLTRVPGKLIINMVYCTALTGVCFVATFVLFQMAGNVLPPMLGAWLPVLVFGPMALASLDMIQT